MALGSLRSTANSDNNDQGRFKSDLSCRLLTSTHTQINSKTTDTRSVLFFSERTHTRGVNSTNAKQSHRVSSPRSPIIPHRLFTFDRWSVHSHTHTRITNTRMCQRGRLTLADHSTCEYVLTHQRMQMLLASL